MKEGVVIPAYNRVEFLQVCVDFIKAADNPPPVVVVVDNHIGAPPSDEVVRLVRRMESSGDVEAVFLTPHPFKGLNYGIMNSLMVGLIRGWDLTFYVEDDVVVGEDFFDWHRAIHREGDWWASVSCRNHCETPVEVTDDPNHYYTTDADYTACGTCFPRASLKDIAEHAGPVYWDDPGAYVTERYPNSRVHRMYCMQAGLIRRIVEADPKKKTVWPCVPRSFHIGWYGHHCKGQPIPGNTREERVAFVLRAMKDPELLNDLAESHPNFTAVDTRRKPMTKPTFHKHYP